MSSLTAHPGRALAFVIAMTAAVVTAPAASAVAPPPEPRTTWVVQLQSAGDVPTQAADARADGVSVSRTFTGGVPAMAVTATQAQAADLATQPGVVAVEPDVVVRASGTETPAPWGLDRVDQRARPLNHAYVFTSGGRGVRAYVIDSGLRSDHVELARRVAPGYTAVTDGRSTGDCNGHGTHVSATIAGATFGVAKQATVVPVRVLGCDNTGTLSGVLAGLDWAVKDHIAGTPAVANLSLGLDGVSSTLDAAVQALIADGVSVSVAAGNASVDACTTSPARVPAALTVGATDSADQQASFSNFGSCLDLFAPGVMVPSAWYTSPTATNTISGTSMAAPHVTGAAALVLGVKPSLNPAQVAATLTGTATTGVVAGRSAGTPDRLLFTGGLPVPPTSPAIPTSVSATLTSRGAATVSWTRSGDGGAPLTGHTIRAYRGTQLVLTVQVPGTASSAKVGGLSAGASYVFTVSATNIAGMSPQSGRSAVLAVR